MRIKPVRHDTHRAGRRTDKLAEAACRKQAFENEAVSERRKSLLRLDIDAPSQRGRSMVQASAMRRVEPADALSLAFQPARREPCIGPALGAVAMQDVDLEARGEALHLAVTFEV